MKSRLPVVGCCFLTTLLIGIWLGQSLPLKHEVDEEIVDRSIISPFNSDGWQLASGQEFGPSATLQTESPFEKSPFSNHPASRPFRSEPVEPDAQPIGPDVAYFPEVITGAAGEADPQSSATVRKAHSEESSPATATLSQEDAAVWSAELKNLPPEQAEEILNLRRQLGSVASESLGLSFPEMPPVENAEPPGLFPELAAGDARPIPIAGTFSEDVVVVHASAAKESRVAKQLRKEAERNYAQNIANIRTPGYKRRQIVLLNVPVAPTKTEAAQADLSVIDASSEIASPVDSSQNLWVSRLDLRQGKLASTSNPLDLAIDGPGWLQVDRNGRPEYVRGGVLALNQHRELNIRTSSGLLPIQPAVSLPDDTRRIIITSTGEVIAVDLKESQKAVGQLISFEFLNASALKRTAVGTYVETKEVGNAIASNSSVKFLQSFLEEANVDPQRELAEFDHLQAVAENLVATENHETSP
jgi:flagellar basal-body rod protein FlgG